MKQGTDEAKMVAAARNAAIKMDRNNPARQIIYDLVNAFEKLHNAHDICAISRPRNTVPSTVPASCECLNKLNGVKLCRDHAIDRLTWIGHTMAPYYELSSTLVPERQAISDALAHDIVKVTKVPAQGAARVAGTPKPLDANKLAALKILSSIPGTTVKK